MDRARITTLLTTKELGRSLDLRAETGSTNDDARTAADKGAPHGHVVLADAQTHGRGARGRTWSSPGGTDLYFSIVARLTLAPPELPLVTLAVGLGVARAVDAASAQRTEIKWPNDVLISGKKCAGILVETATTGDEIEALVIGVGVDVNRPEFDAELETIATSLALVTGSDHDREALFASLLGEIESALEVLVARGADVVRDVDERLALRGERVQVGETTGVVDGLDARGALLLRDDAGIVRSLVSGTVERA